MSVFYSIPAGHEKIQILLPAVIKKYHQKLHDYEVRVLILYAADSDGPALKKNGHAVAAQIRPLPLLWRVIAQHDALLLVDEAVWNDLEDDSKVALLDHELSHLDVCEAKDDLGNVSGPKLDNADRPKLRTVKGDFNSGDGFTSVIIRHGDAALEASNSERIHKIVAAALNESLQMESEPVE